MNNDESNREKPIEDTKKEENRKIIIHKMMMKMGISKHNIFHMMTQDCFCLFYSKALSFSPSFALYPYYAQFIIQRAGNALERK